jgi:hypothetical protein
MILFDAACPLRSSVQPARLTVVRTSFASSDTPIALSLHTMALQSRVCARATRCTLLDACKGAELGDALCLASPGAD